MQLILLANRGFASNTSFQAAECVFHQTLPCESQQQKILPILPVFLAVTITLFNLHSRISVIPFFKTCFSLWIYCSILIGGGETIQYRRDVMEQQCSFL